jgi:mRNA-degrading endonuclease RelE of RelBE toxin-antitoxin system
MQKLIMSLQPLPDKAPIKYKFALKFPKKWLKVVSAWSKKEKGFFERTLKAMRQIDIPTENTHCDPLRGKLAGYYKLKQCNRRLILDINIKTMTISVVKAANRDKVYNFS